MNSEFKCLIKSSLLKKFNARMEKPIYKPKWRYQLCYHIRTSQMHWEVETGFPDLNHHVGMKSVVNIFILLLHQDHSNIFSWYWNGTKKWVSYSQADHKG